MAEINTASRDTPEQLKFIREQVIEAGEQYRKALKNIEQRQYFLLEDSSQERQKQEANLLSVSVNTTFDRLRNIISHQPGIPFQTRDKLLSSSEEAQKLCLLAIKRRGYDKVEPLMLQIKDILGYVPIIDNTPKKKPDKETVEQFEKFAQELDTLLKRCISELTDSDIFSEPSPSNEPSDVFKQTEGFDQADNSEQKI